MRVIAVSMFKDEADIAEVVLRHLADQVDAMIVADNGSTDGTREILESLARELPLEVIDDSEVGYFQSEKMTRLAGVARERGADWILPCDADEIWYSPFGRVGDILSSIAPQWLVAPAALYDHVATALDPADANPVRRIGWRRLKPGRLPKVACRWRPDLVIEQGNHGARYHGGTTALPGQLVIRHFPYRSAEQFVRKARNGAAAYRAATGLPESMGAHWRGYGAIADAHGDEACADIFRLWFWSGAPAADETLIFDPAPIRGAEQPAEVRP